MRTAHGSVLHTSTSTAAARYLTSDHLPTVRTAHGSVLQISTSTEAAHYLTSDQLPTVRTAHGSVLHTSTSSGLLSVHSESSTTTPPAWQVTLRVRFPPSHEAEHYKQKYYNELDKLVHWRWW